MASPDPTLDTQQHVARDGQNDKRDDEQNEAERDQRGGVEVANGFRELVGDRGRDGRAGMQDGGRDLVGVADDEGDGHGLAQGAAEAQHDAADHAHPRVGQDHGPEHLPGGAANAVGGLLEHGGDGVEYVAGNGGDEGQNHDGQDEARGQNADAVGRTGEQRRQHGNAGKRIDEGRLQRLLQDGGEYEEAPDAIDDARDAGEQLNGDADRTAQPQRAELGEEEGHEQANRH